MKALCVLLLVATSAAGQCQDGWCPQPQYYTPPQRPPQRQPQVAPEYEPRPNVTENPPPAKPPSELKPCECGPKWTAFEAWQKQQTAVHQQQLQAIESVAVAVKAQKCDCQPCDLTPLQTKLDALIAAVGGIKIPPPTAPPQDEQHVVVVADQNAPYWQRLAEQIERTKQTYHGVQVAGMPTFPLGVHPQAVVYKNSVPVRIAKGQYDVEALLSRLARGEAI